jgi:TolA-binding protein
VIDEHPRTEYSARALYQIGRLQFERQFDLDEAIASFSRANEEFGGKGPLGYELTLRTGEVLVAKGDTAAAKGRFADVAAAPDALPDQADEAAFRLAELDYFSCLFDSARAKLESIVVNTRADYANDALALQNFLQEQRAAGDESAAMMARADLLARRHAFSEAVAAALQIVSRSPSSSAADDALLRVAAWQEASGRAGEAAITYERLLVDYREVSPLLDRALFRLGRLFERSLHDDARAMAAYERLLTEFPKSVLAAEARRNLRRLRGDVL